MPGAVYSSAITAHGTKLYLVGGATANVVGNPDALSAKVYIYDTVTEAWTEQPLSNPRHAMQGLTVGDKLLFAGGADYWNGSAYIGTTDTVDVYDAINDTWSIEHLSAPRRWVSSAVVGGKAYLAGGRYPDAILSDRLDIYDPATGEWTLDTLPEAANYCAAAGGDKLLLWAEANCHVLNTLTQEWESFSFVNTRGYGRTTVSTTDEVWFIGGYGYLDTIDIYNIAAGTWRTENLQIPRLQPSAFSMNGKIVIAGGDDGTEATKLVETYDTQTGQWLELSEMNEARYWITNANNQAPVIGNQAFFPGGTDFNVSHVLATMDIYTDTTGTTNGLFTPILKNLSIQTFPSPFLETLIVQVDFEKPVSGSLEVYDLPGSLIFSEKVDNQAVWNKTIATQGWAAGAYLLKVRTVRKDSFGAEGVAIRKVVKI